MSGCVYYIYVYIYLYLYLPPIHPPIHPPRHPPRLPHVGARVEGGDQPGQAQAGEGLFFTCWYCFRLHGAFDDSQIRKKKKLFLRMPTIFPYLYIHPNQTIFICYTSKPKPTHSAPAVPPRQWGRPPPRPPQEQERGRWRGRSQRAARARSPPEWPPAGGPMICWVCVCVCGGGIDGEGMYIGCIDPHNVHPHTHIYVHLHTNNPNSPGATAAPQGACDPRASGPAGVKARG